MDRLLLSLMMDSVSDTFGHLPRKEQEKAVCKKLLSGEIRPRGNQLEHAKATIALIEELEKLGTTGTTRTWSINSPIFKTWQSHKAEGAMSMVDKHLTRVIQDDFTENEKDVPEEEVQKIIDAHIQKEKTNNTAIAHFQAKKLVKEIRERLDEVEELLSKTD